MAMSDKKTQQDLFKNVWITAGIFSSHYLLERMPQAGPKIWPSDEEALPLYKAVKELHENNIVGLRKGNEAETERRFIDKVFNKLGFGYLNQNKIPESERRQVPDYFLYTNYEGLLEHKFSFQNGRVVLKNDKGERKATGAYYTPDYIENGFFGQRYLYWIANRACKKY